MIRTGDKIGPYTLISKLGRGTFGVVWLAEKRTSLAVTKVALKLPNDDGIDLEAVKREAAVWVEASGHPNVLPIIDADIYDEQVVIVSEYAPDGSLADWIKEHGGKAPTIEAAVEMTASILDGLAHLHARRIIHRDLKPANILLQGKTPRLVDFGLARVLKTTGQSSNVSGTYAYMPPEAFDGKRSEQTDVWSAGVILYQMLTGRLPYPQTDDAALIGALLTREPEPPPDDLPGVLRKVLIHSLQKNPADRYQSVVEMHEALRGNVHPPAPVLPAPQAASELEFPTQKFTAPSVEPIVAPLPPFPQSPSLPPGVSEQQAPESQFMPPQKTITQVPFISGSPPPFQSGVPEQRRGSLWLIVSVLAGVLIVGLVIAGSLGAFSSRDDSLTGKGDSTIRQPAISSATTNTSRATTGGSASPLLRSYQFGTVKVDSTGNVIERREGQAQSFSENIGGVTLEMVKIPSGTFTMGSPVNEVRHDIDEGPEHQVSVSEFYMGKYEVTQAQWRAVASLPKVRIDLNPDPSGFKGDSQPVEQVSWDDVGEFCARLSRATGREYRLPSEAEWEYAARAGTQTPFAFGDTITPEIVNYDGNYPYGGAAEGLFRQKTMAVGALGVANGFGLYDMHGNVGEWCADVRHDNYNGAPTDGTAWVSGGSSNYKVLRGGSWFLYAYNLRSANRDGTTLETRSNTYGFRVVTLARM